MRTPYDPEPEDLKQRDRWRQRAACRDTPTELFYPLRKERTSPGLVYCNHCPVVAECLAYAKRTDDTFAVLGGTTPMQRHWTRRAGMRRE